MRVYKKIGTKERLLEMFEKVNKIKLNESPMWGEEVSNEKYVGPSKEQTIEFITQNEIELDEAWNEYLSYLRDSDEHKTYLSQCSECYEEWVEEKFWDDTTKTYDLNRNYLDESFDSPMEKDEKYLDKTVGDESSQVSKYDDGTRYPVEDKLKVKDPSLEKLKGDDAPITEDFDDAPKFKPQAQLTTSNFGGMEIELDDSGDGLRYRWNQSGNPEEPVEAEIEYDTDGEPYFKTAEGENYFLSDFMRVNYPQINEAEDDQDITDENPVDNDSAEEKPAWDEDFGGDDTEETEVEDPEMSTDDIPADEESELDNEIDVPVDLETSDGEEINTDTEEVEAGFEDQIDGGMADDAQPHDFCPVQIAKGIQIEMEHTDDPKIALEIAMDHLTEIPDYYTRLENMEADAKGENAMSADDEGAPEDSLLYPEKHWVDDYSPKNVSMGDEIEEDYPLEGGDPEAGEEEFEFQEKAKNGEFNDKKELPKDPSKLVTNPNIDDFSKLAGY